MSAVSRNLADAARAAVLSRECHYNTFTRMLAIVLIQLGDWKEGDGWSGQERIAECMGVSVRSVFTYLNKLESDTEGPIVLVREKRPGRTDRYSYTLRNQPRQVLPDTSERLADPSGTSCVPPRQDLPTISLGVTPSDNLEIGSAESENSFLEDRPSASSKLTETDRFARYLLPPDWRPNETHMKSAKRLKVDVRAVLSAFHAHYRGRAGSERTPLEWDRTFGGWLKRQPPKAEKQLSAEEQDIADFHAGRGKYAEPAPCPIADDTWQKVKIRLGEHLSLSGVNLLDRIWRCATGGAFNELLSDLLDREHVAGQLVAIRDRAWAESNEPSQAA